MRNFIKAGFVWGGMLLSFAAQGQSIPLGALPMQYIGSFAGEAGAPRLNVNSIYYWKGSRAVGVNQSEGFHSFVSYDHFTPAIRTGVGITAGTGRGASKTHGQDKSYKEHFLALDIAPKISIKGKYTLSPSISIHYIRSIDEYAGHEFRIGGFGSWVGLLWNTPKYYIGYSFNGIGYNPYTVLPYIYHFTSFFQLGYAFQKSSESDFSFTPQLVILVSNPFRNLQVNKVDRYIGYNMNFRYKKFIWGLNNAGVHLGVQTARLRLMVTNNAALVSQNRYVGNLSFRYVFKEKF